MREWVIRAFLESEQEEYPRDFLVAAEASTLAISLAKSHDMGLECQDFKIYCGPFKTSRQESQVINVVQDGEIIWTSISEGGERDVSGNETDHIPS